MVKSFRKRKNKEGKAFFQDNPKIYKKPDKSEKQKRVDAILDKISKSGYESLSDKEKNFLNRYGEE